MKILHSLQAIAIALLLFTTSCDKMLDLQPETNPLDETMWKTAAAFEKEANNFYTFLPKFLDQTATVGGVSGTVTFGAFTRDQWSDLTMDPSTANVYSNSTYGKVAVDPFYSKYFERMRSINYLLKNAASYPRSASEIAQYVAEANFFRAYISYLAFADYGPLTIVKTVLDVDSTQLTAPRASRDEFANFIIGDLEAAINSNALPLQSAIDGKTTDGRITLGAAQALLARVCLFEGTWQKYHFNNTSRSNELLAKAAKYAELVMNDASYKLFYNSRLGSSSYRYMFIMESSTQCNPASVLKSDNKEYIFCNRFNELVRQSAQNITHASSGVMMTRKLVEMFPDLSGNITTPDYKTSLSSYKTGRDPRLSTEFTAVGELYWNYSSGSTFVRDQADYNKTIVRSWNGNGFYNNKFASERSMVNTADGFDVPIIRLAEVYLIFAEAKSELGTLTQADLDKSFNLIRDRVNMPHLLATSSDVLNTIRKERAIELYLEGFRYDDLRRWKTAETEMSGNLEGVWMGTGSAYAAASTVINYSVAPYNSIYGFSINKSLTYTSVAAKKFATSADGYSIREAAASRKFTSKFYLRPLPTKQIELNPNLAQNPGWE